MNFYPERGHFRRLTLSWKGVEGRLIATAMDRGGLDKLVDSRPVRFDSQ